MPLSEVFNMDCMEGMKEYPDKYFDLAIVDPPYGINAEQGTNRKSRKQFSDKQYGWDSCAPSLEYFIELFRISKNQIIWGANHFIENIPSSNTKCWLVWDKKNPDRCFADAELAWCSNIDNVRIINIKRVQELNVLDGGKIHPTQKPTHLFDWIMKRFCNEGDKILDTHLGSGSSRIAAYALGFDFTAFELDKDYYDAQDKRFQAFKADLDARDSMFKPIQIKQESLF